MTKKIRCDYCGSPAKLIDSKEIYGEDTNYGMMWACLPCDARVGIHKNSPSHAPLGRLANGLLRRLKQKAHTAFDPIWKKKTKSRSEAYSWLARHMNIPKEKCHIGMFSPKQCEEVIEHCEKFKKQTMSLL